MRVRVDSQHHGPRGHSEGVSVRSIILPMDNKQFCSAERAARASLGRVPVLSGYELGRHVSGNFIERSLTSVWSDLGSITMLATPPRPFYSQGWVDRFQRGPCLSSSGFPD